MTTQKHSASTPPTVFPKLFDVDAARPLIDLASKGGDVLVNQITASAEQVTSYADARLRRSETLARRLKDSRGNLAECQRAMFETGLEQLQDDATYLGRMVGVFASSLGALGSSPHRHP